MPGKEMLEGPSSLGMSTISSFASAARHDSSFQDFLPQGPSWVGKLRHPPLKESMNGSRNTFWLHFNASAL